VCSCVELPATAPHDSLSRRPELSSVGSLPVHACYAPPAVRLSGPVSLPAQSSVLQAPEVVNHNICLCAFTISYNMEIQDVCQRDKK